MPPKKERGKQRKAAKSLAAVNGVVVNISKTVALIRKGDHKTTIDIGSGNTTQSLEEFNGISYEQSGILSTVLKFLKRCEDDTFVKVMLDIGGDLQTPRFWVQVLIKAEAQEESCRLQIAQNIGPLVRCMCNDTKRQFFKSTKHWREAMQAFSSLIHNMILSTFASNSPKDKEVMDTLLKYEGLLTSIVHWGFWNEDCRPDITKELNIELDTATLNRLIRAADTQTEEGRKRLEVIGTTPIINKQYDPECTISLVVGLIRQTKIEGWTMDASTCLRRLIINVSCVDKDVITEMIDLGINTSDDEWVVHVAVVLDYMILKEYTDGFFYPNDTKVAFAIRGGLIELWLTFIERFGVLESFDKKRDGLESLFVSVKSILSSVYWVGSHKKTAKAIRSKRSSIGQKLARLEQNTEITSNANCKKVIGMARSMLDINGLYCCRCNKQLRKTEVKLCNGCHRMSYCSRACQREDWFGGHSITCCKPCTNANVGQFQGRYCPEKTPDNERAAANLKELEINANMIQLRLFFDHSETILSQVEALNIPLYDCIVKFNLTKCPVEVKTRKYTEFGDTPERKRGFEDSRSKGYITCIFMSCIYDGSLVEGQIATLKSQRLFPHEWLSKKKVEVTSA